MGDLAREVDVAVVGGGPGGYSAAFRCAELGLDAVIVDAGTRLGGVCLYEGCIPSKALLHVAALIHEVERATQLGVEFAAPRITLDPLRKWKDERVVSTLASGLAGLARSKGVEVIGGHAVLDGSQELRVVGEERRRLRFQHAIVATGSRPRGLPGVRLASDRIMDSTAALRLADVPERLLVIGGGCVGLELGQVYAALGSAVTLVEMTGELLPGVDRDLVLPLARQIERQFAAVHLETEIADLREVGTSIEARLGAVAERFDRALVAVGRQPLSAGLGLETTRVRLTPGGAIAIDERCRTGDSHIYAVGDVTGDPMLAHRAMRQGRVAAEVIAGRPSAFDNVAIPTVVFTDPEVAWCGLTEREAERQGREVHVAKVTWAASGRAATLGRADGLSKLVIDPSSGRVVGVGIVGPGAGELIAEAALAVETAVTAEDVATTIHAHPTLAETLMGAAEAFLRAAG